MVKPSAPPPNLKGRNMPILHRPLLLLAAALPAAIPSIAYAQSGSALVIWPLNPTIQAHEKAAALWLENPGDQPITFQVQSYAWAQQDGEDVYASQNEVMATPPLVTLAPKSKQLIRITRLGPPPPQAERPYRVIVDEIPIERPADPASATKTTTGLQFRMRYSLPLFSYAPHMLPTSDAAPAAGEAAQAADKNTDKKGRYPAPNLVWHFSKDGKNQIIHIENRGNGHARLTQAKIASSSGTADVATGLMGYVLAGSRLRYSLPTNLAPLGADPQFIASVNAAPPAPLPAMRPALHALASSDAVQP